MIPPSSEQPEHDTWAISSDERKGNTADVTDETRAAQRARENWPHVRPGRRHASEDDTWTLHEHRV